MIDVNPEPLGKRIFFRGIDDDVCGLLGFAISGI